MADRIIPAVLARSATALRRQWNLACDYDTVVHLDVADGTLVSGRTVSPKTLARLDRTVPVEIHCMTNRPDRWLEPMMRLRTTSVVLHVELGADVKTYVAFVRSHHWRVSLAINPETSLTRLWPWLKQVDGVQVMGVNPGRQRAPWHAATVARIRAIHRRRPQMVITCDGGMTPMTIPLVRQAGARRFVVGSFLQNHADPDRAWWEVRQAARA